METLTKEEMKKINGGGISVWMVLGIGAIVTFLAGVIDGIVRPIPCER